MRTPSLFDTAPRFDGPAYDPALDQARLTRQLGRVFQTMRDGRWRTMQEIALATGDLHASISEQLRHLRKPRFGAYLVEKRRRGTGGTWEYRLRRDGDGRGRLTARAGADVRTPAPMPSATHPEADARMMPPLPEHIIEQLAELWCEALLANLRRRRPSGELGPLEEVPVQSPRTRAPELTA